MWMWLLIHFVLKNVYVPFGSCNIMFLSFILVWVVEFWTWKPNITQNVKYNSVALLLGYNQVSFTQRYSISFPFIFDTFCPYLESLTCFQGKYLIIQSLNVHLKHTQKSSVEVSSCSCHLSCVWLCYFFQKHVLLQLIHIYINSTC